jgi:hypothetical protein
MVGVKGLQSDTLNELMSPVRAPRNCGGTASPLALQGACTKYGRKLLQCNKSLAIAAVVPKIRFMLQCSNSAQSNSFPESCLFQQLIGD